MLASLLSCGHVAFFLQEFAKETICYLCVLNIETIESECVFHVNLALSLFILCFRNEKLVKFCLYFAVRLALLLCHVLGQPLLGSTQLVIPFNLQKLHLLFTSVSFALKPHELKCRKKILISLTPGSKIACQ